MSIEVPLILALVAFILTLVPRGELRGWLIFVASVLCLFWMQPSIPIRYVDFWLPALTLWLTGLVWLASLPKGRQLSCSDVFTAGVAAGLILIIAGGRYLPSVPWLTSSLPPSPVVVLAVLGPGFLILLALWLIGQKIKKPTVIMGGAFFLLLAALIVLKSPFLSLSLAKWLRLAAGLKPELATTLDIRWIGFSYICFRLFHVLRDRMSGRLGEYDLRTFVNYVIFFPSLLAGPIDRIERFARDYQKGLEPVRGPSHTQATVGVGAMVFSIPVAKISFWLRSQLDKNTAQAFHFLFVGLFKKFVVADTLALIALGPANALQVQTSGWLWLLTYVYAFQIYFDFAGYTDIAIGLGMFLGIRLPDNFAAPYRKTNLALFWNSWHMSLTNWLRAYLFNPFVRTLRAKNVPGVTALFLGQVATMLVIGVWHGVTWNFVIWGMWHGIGQFVQNRWSGWMKPWFAARSLTPVQARAVNILSVALTFQYVALGWVWFALPTPRMAWLVVQRLFGAGFD